jgi:PST family polysaccharide transporter
MLSLFLLVLKPEDYILVPLLHGIFMLISVITSFIIIHKHFKLNYIRPSKADIKKILKEGRHAFIVQLAPTLYNSTTTFILGYTATYALVGIYASATKLIDALNSISIIILNTFLPYLSIDIKRHKTFSYIMWFVALILVILAFVFSDFLITFLYGAKNLVVSDWFKVLIPMVLFIFIRNTYGPSYLMLIDKERVYKNIVLYSCIVFFILSMVLVPIYSLKGAVFIMLGASFVMSLFTYYYYLKYRNRIK